MSRYSQSLALCLVLILLCDGQENNVTKPSASTEREATIVDLPIPFRIPDPASETPAELLAPNRGLFDCQCSDFMWRRPNGIIVGRCLSTDIDHLPICYLHVPNNCRDAVDSQQFCGMQVTKIGCGCELDRRGFCKPRFDQNPFAAPPRPRPERVPLNVPVPEVPLIEDDSADPPEDDGVEIEVEMEGETQAVDDDENEAEQNMSVGDDGLGLF